MTQYNTLNVKLSNPQLNKLKLEIKNGTEITLNINQMLLVILKMKKILLINCYYLILKFQGFVKFLQIITQRI